MKRWIMPVLLMGSSLALSGCLLPPETARSDAAQVGLAAAIRQRLQADPQTAACWVSVTVEDGTVIVRGRVATPGLRERVLTKVRETPGVSQVDDQLFVR